jgi:hypothetical protein
MNNSMFATLGEVIRVALNGIVLMANLLAAFSKRRSPPRAVKQSGD